ncbi:MAG: hypothetical protein HLUCCO06_12975 [Halomonas sp. HL-93]|nr:MAG: hypothetical protein HLUCCO06_12975 [Halomonas sp. HL-93]
MSTPFNPRRVRNLVIATSMLVSVMTGASAQDNSNTLTLAVEGEENVLYISQVETPSGSGSGATNQIDITIAGERNGGAASGWVTDLPSDAPLMPGELMQAGSGNKLSLNVQGQNNLFAMSQTGEGNRITGQIIGQSNEALVVQNGMDNTAVFSQSGQGNTIMVSQSSL